MANSTHPRFVGHKPYTDAELRGGVDLHGGEAMVTAAVAAHELVLVTQARMDEALSARQSAVADLYAAGATKYRLAKLLGLSQTSVANILADPETRKARKAKQA